MKSICVYCGSNAGSKPAYTERAIALGDRIARDGLRLVYGGGNVGLIGTVANAVLAAGGEVTGVIPRQLADWEVAHRGLTELEIVGSMHERKSRMFDLSDAFVALPGAAGTLEELFEAWTWGMLGLHAKPTLLLDVDDFWQPLVTQLHRMVDDGYLDGRRLDALGVVHTADGLLEFVDGYQHPERKWTRPARG